MMFRNQGSSGDPTLFPVLFPEHKEYLEARGVSEEVAKAARLSSVTKYKAAELIGWKSLSSGGLAIPYSPEPNKSDHWRIRLDEPLTRPDGKGEQRFASPTGEGARPYLPRFLPEEVWQDTKLALVIVEGPIKALALLGQNLLGLGLAGVDTGHDPELWREKKQAQLGEELLRRVAWSGRKVVLLFDAGRATNYRVFRAERRLADALEAAGAQVFVAELPLTSEGKDQGPDDYLAKHGPLALHQIIAGARPKAEVHDPAAELIDELNEQFAVVSLGGTVRILRESYDPESSRSRLDFLPQKDFELLLKNRSVTVGEKTFSAGSYWLRHRRRRTCERVILLPGNDDPRYYNLWKGFAVEPKPGDWSRLRTHLRENLCRGKEEHFNYLLALLADGVQNPGQRPGVSLCVRGREGTGKSAFAKHYGYLFGQHCRTVSQARHLTGHFNGHLADTLLLICEEAFWAGDKTAAGPLKDLITGETLNLERKGKDVTTVLNRIRLIFLSNEDWVVPAGLDARRFFVLDAGADHQQDRPYFAAMEKQMHEGGYGGLLYDLLSKDLSQVDLGAVPSTRALFEQKLFSFSVAEKFWYGCLDRGEIVPWRPWEGETLVPLEEIHRAYLEQASLLGERRKSTETELAMTLRKLCPLLSKKQRTVAVYRPDPEHRGNYLQETKQTRCYLLPPLERCRKAFEAALKTRSLPWDEDDPTPTPGEGAF